MYVCLGVELELEEYIQSSNRLLNHSSSSTTSPALFDLSFAWKATSMVTSWPFC